MKKLLALSVFLAPFVVVTGIFITIYSTVQQDQRSAANDPQIQMAEDTAVALDHGKQPADLVGQSVKVDESLAPFLIIYDGQGKVLASSASLNEQTPALPDGVLGQKGADGLYWFKLKFESWSNDYHTLTWQPRNDVRIAAVITHYENGYVLAGRSLKETEKRESKTALMALIGWALSMLVVAGYLVVRPKTKS